jgi:CcmD family protein
MIKRLIFICSFVCLAATASAQDTKTATPAKLPAGFERVAGGVDTDQVDANKMVVGAYAAFFLLFFGYIVYVARTQAGIAKEMTELSERIRRAEKK